MAHPIEEDQFDVSAFDAGVSSPKKKKNWFDRTFTVERPESIELNDYKGFEDLYSQFNDPKNRGLGFRKTVEQKVDNYNGRSGTIKISHKDKNDYSIKFWPDMGQEWVDEQNLKIYRAGTLANLPTHIAPVAAAGAALKGNYFYMPPKTKRGMQNVTPTQGQVSGTTTKGNLQSKEGALQTRISQFQAGGSKSTRDLGLTTEYAKDMRLGIVPASKQRQDYIKWDKGALKHYEKVGSMRGYRSYTDPATGLVYRKGMESGQIKNISKASRKERGAKRDKTTKINKDKAYDLIVNKYHQSEETYESFLEYQRVRKKSLDNTIKKINERIKKNPDLYRDEDGKVLKASLGHGRAAKRYEDSADVITNIDKENYRRNVKRSNLDEVSDRFNRGLGRSIDLEEEILKFLYKDLRDFHRTGGGLKLGRHQQDDIIDHYKEHADDDIDWESEIAPTGEQLFKSKEEFLQNEGIEKFRGDKLRSLEKTLVDVRSDGFGAI